MSDNQRTATVQRATGETRIELALNLDGTGHGEVKTGIGMLDHLLTSLARHAALDLTLSCHGDLQVDDHHTAEDCGIALGQAIDLALGDRAGIVRFGHSYAPLDESLVRAVIDLSGRPGAWIHLPLRRDAIGGLSCENVSHVLSSLAIHARATLHVDLIRGENDHHIAEAAFKALALALSQAISRRRDQRVPSTKEVL